ncbi:UDP-N-acetylmuramate dehydrogenase [Martelella soudanensis]|uniref:UDP-N-acetylmuramate dehydrogenase n=1 Tax=unclassified Martelella TaxID=2629616 RepID=UPI0015DF5C28|nr:MULTISPECIES: UDP-N-acetylmuramate dehydrogenase [unclassified Martelella]
MDMISDFDLTGSNTMGLKSFARRAVIVDDPTILPALARESAASGLPLYFLGGGSNVVLRERLEAIVALMRIGGRKVARQTDTHSIVTAGAGENWHDFVAWTIAEDMPGLENLAGIPGTVGAAPIQNIGAYGAQLSDFFLSLEAYDLQGGVVRTFDAQDCRFGYRQSHFKTEPGRHVILSVTLALPRAWRPKRDYAGLDQLPEQISAREVLDHVVALRASKLPDWRVLGNAGSFFHNPVVSAEKAAEIAGAPRYPQPDGTMKLSAGWLIEQCGLKGFRLGPAGTYDRHALVLVNHGGATRTDIAALAAHIREKVRDRFDVELVQEPIEL